MKSKETKERIRQAAIEVFAEVGFHNCNTDKIAEKAGVAVGTIYNYFENKDDILSYIFEVEYKKIKDFFCWLDNLEKSIPEKINQFFKEYYKRVLENKKLAKLLHDESNRPARGLSEEIFNYLSLIHSFLQDLLIKGIKEGTVRADNNPEIMAAAIMGAAGSVALRGYLEPERLEDICQKAPDKLSRIFSGGIFISK